MKPKEILKKINICGKCGKERQIVIFLKLTILWKISKLQKNGWTDDRIIFYFRQLLDDACEFKS